MRRMSSRGAAARRLTEIEAEMARIIVVFPELRRSSHISARLRLPAHGRRRADAKKHPDAPRHA